jgi:hypothetical protein
VRVFVDPSGTLVFTFPIRFSRTVGAFALGLGTDVSLSRRLGLSLDWRYHRPFTSEQVIGEREIRSTSYWSTRAGIALRMR